MATNTAGSTARQTHMELLHTLRFVVNYNDAGIAIADTKKVGTLPAGALIVGTDVFVTTAFNAATTNVLSVGYEPTTNANIVTNAQALAGALGLKQNLPPNGLALAPIVADSAVYALYTQTGAVATAGKAVIVIKFVVNNDFAPQS